MKEGAKGKGDEKGEKEEGDNGEISLPKWTGLE